MRRIGKIEYEKYILPVGIAVAGYLVLKNLGLFGSAANSSNNSAIDQTTAAGVNAAINQARQQGDFATLTPAQTAGIASSIYNSGIASPVDMDGIQNQIIQVNTLTDLLQIIQAFGTKQAGDYWSTCNFLGFNCQSYDLRSFLRAVLDQGHINTINNYLSSDGINYQF